MTEVVARNPSGVFPPYAGYAHSVEVPPNARTLYISGLNGYESDGATMPSEFAGQARLVWQHLGDHRACRTVVVQQLLEPEWLIEVEAIAARVDDPTSL